MSFEFAAVNSARGLSILLLGLAAACGSPVGGGTCASSESALTETAVFAPTANPSDAADSSCQVVLRHSEINSGGTVTATVDISGAQDDAQAVPHVLYQGASGEWHQQSGAKISNPQPGFHRYQFILDRDTNTSGNDTTEMQISPFLQTANGRLFDNNNGATCQDPLR